MSNSLAHFEVQAIDRPWIVVEEIIKPDDSVEPGRRAFGSATIIAAIEPYGIIFPHVFEKLTVSMRGEVWAFHNATLGLLKSEDKVNRAYSILYERVEMLRQPPKPEPPKNKVEPTLDPVKVEPILDPVKVEPMTSSPSQKDSPPQPQHSPHDYFASYGDTSPEDQPES